MNPAYQNFLFLLFDDELDEVFVPKNNTKVFEYIKYDFYFEEYSTNGKLILRDFIDDSFPIWEYEYFKNRINLKKESLNCE